MPSSNVEIDGLINGFSQAAYRGNAAWFIGAGASKAAGIPNWLELLNPLGRELGITITNKDDLPAIAQYYINKSSGNRGPLVGHMNTVLNISASPSSYHINIARSSVTTIWTTNYDHLMEDALIGLQTRTRCREGDFIGHTERGTIEIIKAHGSFGTSTQAEFVIASNDYEDFAGKRPAMAARLRADILSKSFLFVGYGYNDPNIKTILLEARRLAEGASLRHWMLLTEVDLTDTEEHQRQTLWKEDLGRIGIKCILVKDYAEVERIVSDVAIKSRGPTLYVTGSHTGHSSLAEEVGAHLAKPNGPILLDGQSAGVSRSLITAFQAKAIDERVDLNHRLRYFPNPYSSNPKLSNDPSLLPTLKKWRRALLRQAHTVLAFDGGMGTEAETEIAFELGCLIVPVPTKPGGSSSKLLDIREIANPLEQRAPGYVKKAKALSLTSNDIYNCIIADMPL